MEQITSALPQLVQDKLLSSVGLGKAGPAGHPDLLWQGASHGEVRERLWIWSAYTLIKEQNLRAFFLLTKTRILAFL